eukprot:COSAG01_NODE_2631_length_7340_cov_35.191686_7_plen_123_part_00
MVRHTIKHKNCVLGRMEERPAVQGAAQLVKTASGQRMIHPELTKPEWKLPPPGADSATSKQRIEAIVYENHHAFPHYLVTYTAGPRENPYQIVDRLRKIDSAPNTTNMRLRNGIVESFGSRQ